MVSVDDQPVALSADVPLFNNMLLLLLLQLTSFFCQIEEEQYNIYIQAVYPDTILQTKQ